MKKSTLLAILLSVASYSASAQTEKTDIFSNSIQKDALRFNADSITTGTEVSIPGLIDKVKSLDVSDYIIIYKEPRLTGWKVELDSSKYAQILNTPGWKSASIGTGGITVQNIAYHNKRHALLLFK